MANNIEDIKWLYDKLKAKGYDIGSQEEFTSSLANEDDRDWYYDKAIGMGLNVGSKDDFNSLYAPATTPVTQSQPQTVLPTQTSQPQQAQAATKQPIQTVQPAQSTAQQEERSAWRMDVDGLVEPQATAQNPTPAPQPTWQPTEQDKIRMAYDTNSIVSDFNKRSKARVEQARRVAERNTPEGHKRLKAAKFQAQLAGTPTQTMGLTPDVSPTPANGQGAAGVGEQPKPLVSGQGPVPYGVVEVDGQRKTQWLLPDGTLTTDFGEVDRAEYSARRVRLRDQFVGRMKENGLDPSKQEDVQRQAQLDYETPIRKAVAAAVEADDERSKQEEDAYMSNPLNMIGGTNAALGHAAARKEAGIGDLNLIAEKAYEALPSNYRRELVTSYIDYFTKHPEALHGKTIDQAAQDAAKSVVYSQVHEIYVGRNAPKSATDFFARKMLELNPASVALSGTINPYGQAYAELDAMERYGAEHRGLDIAGTVAGMAIDPITYLSGGVGNIAFKRATRAAGKMMAKRAMGDVARRYATTTLAGRLIGGIAAGGANFGTFEASKDAERQLYQGGYLNPETGEMEGFSFGSVLNSGVHGVGMGAATGVVSPLIGNVADKAVKATSSTAGKVAMRGTEQLLSTVAEGTIFSIPEWINGEQDAFDVWTDNMAMMAGFKLSHAVKTAPSMIRSLRPAKPKGDRPLTRDERIHNNKSFSERVRERMDASPSDIALTSDEREELRSKGYGELSDLFAFDPEHKSRKASQAQSAEGEDVDVKGLSRVVDYEPRPDESGNRDFDGYEAMERLMEDTSVSEAARAKAYYILTGRHLPMSTVTGWNREENEDGTITVTSLSHQGGAVTSRRFANESEAKREEARIQRQVELNTIDIGEQYRNVEAQERVMEAAINEISPGADPQAVYNIYEAVRRGDKNVTEDQRAMADLIDEAVERNSMAGEEVSPAGIRRRVAEETGADVDKAIRKEPEKRTEVEQEAVKKYARALFPEEEAYKASPEQAEADRVYEDSRLLYGRFEQGDPEAQAEFDAISLRMTEAHQLCEDAFGDESEAYMAEIRENPWGVLADPNLTADQKDAVLYYINANAALDGVLDASNEAAADKRQRMQEEVAHRTHKERGVIVPATMKIDDKPTYIIKGEVAMFPDGSGVDVRNSSDAIIILDEQGEYKFVSPDQIMSVGETIDPQTELQTAYEAIDREQEAIVGSATESVPEMPENVPNSAETPTNGTETGTESPQSVPNVEEYDRGYEEGTEVAKSLSDDILNGAIEDLRGRYKEGGLSDEWRGRLEAYEYEQQNRQMQQGAEAPSENIPEEGNNTGQNIPEDEAEGTALSKIPVSEETGDPLLTHESVDADTAWDAAVEFFGTPEDAMNYVESELRNAKTAITAAEKGVTKVKPTGGMKRYRDELTKARAEVERSKTNLAKWEAIAEVQNRRKSEEQARILAERAAEDKRLHDEAVAQFDEEQRIKAEKEAEQEAIGTHAVNPKIKEKWEAAPKVDGHPDIITLADGSTLTGHYVMTEAKAASASHDPDTGFEQTEGFPIDANGQSVNDRDYKGDRDAQRLVHSMADAYDSRAMQTPVIVSKDGIVLSGNNRTMSGDMAAAQGTDGAYLDYLNKYGRKYGFTPEQVEGMEHPRVVFVPDEDLPYDATTFSRFNAQEMKSQSKPEAAIKLGKIVEDSVFNRIVADLNRYDRLSDFYADQETAARTLGELVKAGAINDKQLPELRTGTALSAAGKELIENTLIGKAFQTEPDAVRKIISMPALRQGVMLGLNEIATNRTLSGNGYDLSKELSAAVDLVYRARTAQPEVYKDGVRVSPFGRQQGLFDDEYGDSSVTDATTLLLADLLNSGKPSDVRKVLSMYNQSARESASGVVDIFSETGKPDTKEEILTRINEHFRNATPKEQQALVEAAIEQRKRDAAETLAAQSGEVERDEQAENALQRVEEPEQPSAVAPEAPVNPETDYTPEEEALLARVEMTENDWEEEGSNPDKPVYKREIIIDGEHSVTQVDAPDDKGEYTGPYFEYDGKRFGFVGEVADYIDGKGKGELDDMSLDGVLGFKLPEDAREMTVADIEAWEPLEDEEMGAGNNKAAALGIMEGRIDENEDYFRYGYKLIERSLYKQGILSKPRMDVNTTPTEAQKRAGNYKKGHVRIEGMDISIENPRNSMRRGTDANGEAWESRMTMDYGYIRGTTGRDKDHIDIFLSEDATDPARLEEMGIDRVYVIDQYNKDGSFDEHKVVYGVADPYNAKTSYLENYSADWAEGRRIDVTEVKMDDFKKWAFDGKRKMKPFAEYKEIKSLTEGAEQTESNSYTITPSTYTNKKGKTSDVWHVKFDRDLTTEERAALNTFIQEPLEAGRKTSRGWLDRKNGIYIMRSEEGARELAAMIGNEEAVADAQPLTAEDYQEAMNLPKTEKTEQKPVTPVQETATSEQKPEISSPAKKRKKATPKPKNVATLQEIAEEKPSETPAPIDEKTFFTNGRTLTESMKEIGQTNDLGFDVTVGERYKYDGREIEIQAINGANVRWHDKDLNRTFEEPAGILEGVEPIEKKGQFKVDDEMRAMEDELRSLLGIDDSEGDRGDLFRNPEDFTDEEVERITAIGIRYTLKYFNNGVTSFPDFADRMVRRMGETIRPWLRVFYQGARNVPKYAKLPFTPDAEVYAFDVMNFDKASKDADPMRTAQGIAAEQRAGEAVAKGQQLIKEQRNQTRKENEKQISADTDALAAEAEAIASQAEATAESAKDEREIAAASEKVDEALDKINEQLALLGYYEADLNAPEHEVYGLRRSAEKKAVKDAVKLAKQLVSDLGMDLQKVIGKTTEQNRGKNDSAVRANIAPAGGDITINLPYADGRNLHINIGLSPTHERGVEANPGGGAWEGDNYEIDRIMYRFEGAGRGDGHNHFLSTDVTYGEMLADIQRNAKWGMPKQAITGAPSDKPADVSKVEPAKTEDGYDAGGYWDRHEIKETEKNGFKVGEKVWYTRNDGKKKRELATIVDFGGGSDVTLDTGMAPIMYEACEWSQIEKQEPKKNGVDEKTQKPAAPKKQEVKPEQSVGDLFGGLFDEPEKDEKRTELRTGTGTAEREERHEPRQNEPLGTSQRNEDGGTDGGGMAGSGASDTEPDPGRGNRVSPVSSEHAVESRPKPNGKEPLTRLPQKQRRNIHNHVIKRGSEIAPTSVDARIKANIEAIETMKSLASTGADATPEDMMKLRAFSGWGGLGKAFSHWEYSSRLRKLIGNQAFGEDAQMSRNSAYFTPGYVVDAMWDVARALGFRGGKVLEGSAGIGNIIGLMPPEMSDRSHIQAVEKESTTGAMLRLLYPDASVDVQGFEETKIPNGSIDLAITNVPFVPGLHVKDTTGDKDLSDRFKDIHNFCIAKNVRKLRDGGIGIFITTKGTLDSTGRLFNWLTNEGNSDIVGLFRLHNETFGGTDATSDIIVVRKRVNGQKSPYAIDASTTTGVRTAEYNDGKKTSVRSMSYNRYFVEHPEHMAGEMKFGFETGNTYRPTSISLHPAKGKDQARMLKAWVKEMSQKDFGEQEEVGTEPMNHREEYTPTYDKAGVEVKTGSMQTDSKGRVCVNYDGTLRPLMAKLDKNNPKSEEERIAQFNKNKVKGRTRPQVIEDYNEIKKALNELLDYQKSNETDEGLEPLIKKLNQAYDNFTARYGRLHKNPSISWLKNDVDFASVLALETYREEGLEHTPVFGKADIFRGRVMERVKQPRPQTVKDGVILSIRQSGNLNVDYIAEALNKPVEEVKKEIISQGLGYENPTTHVMEPAHLYLSGNVREKLKLAEVNNENGRYDANINSLRRIVPPTVPSHMIEFSIGSSWLDPKLFSEYVKDRTDLDATFGYAAGSWTMNVGSDAIPEKDKSFGVMSEICNKIIPGHELILAAMTNKTIRVSKTERDGRVTTDPEATQVCASKVDEIRDDFRSWLRSRMQQDEKLATEIETTFNDTFNNSAPIEIPDEYVPERFEGAATVVNGRPLKLRPHQAKAVVRGTMQSLMLSHEVGTGKTYTLITTAMEMRRLGTAKKPMIVVQNSTLGQFVASAKALYPDARILSLEDKDRNAQGRKDFYAKIRYNDWDMVVIPQSVLGKIDDHPDRKRKFIEDTIAEKLDVLDQLAEDKENGRIVANMKKEIEKLQDDLAELHNQEETKKKKKDEKKEAIKKANAKIKAEEMLERDTDDNLNFDDLGIDAILVDEAHEYKHLGFATAMQRGVKGVDPSFSKKCQGLFLKVKAIQERSGGRNVVFATGTPISNTAAEIWTFMRYLMPKEEMEAYNIYYFDDFVRNFGSIQQMLEYGTSGTYKEVNRFAGYNNLPEMGRLWAGVADTVKTEEAGEVKKHIPVLEGGQPTDIHLPQTSALRSVLKFVRAQLKAFEEMSGQEKRENSHIPLTMYGIAKAAAVDARLVSASAPDDPHSKTNEAVRQTLKSLKDTDKYNGTVAIFADNYQRKNKNTKKVEFNLFEDIKQKLIKGGVPESQIWIMNSGMSAKKKEEVFSRVNSGEIRVIMGTTPLLGVGVNIQERLHTLMHLDAPNRPMDYWQRMGRLLRQGNLHKEMGIPVRVLRFGVEDSLDVTAYQRLKTKGAIADAVMNSKKLLSSNLENRVLEEEGDEFGQITAELSGSEYAILQNQTEKELRKLLAKEEQHRTHQTYIHYKIPELRRSVERTEAKIEKLDETIALLESLPAEKTISINGKKYKGAGGMEEVFKADNKALGELIERAENLGTSSTHIVRFTIEGKLPGEIKREVSHEMTNVMGDMGVVVKTTVTIPGIATDRSLKSRWLKANVNEILEILDPDRFKRAREREVNDLANYNRNIEQLSKDQGKPFEHGARIAELRVLLEDYTAKLQADLAAKEKKYAEMDKAVSDLDDISFTSEDDEEEQAEVQKSKGRELSRLVTEGNSLDFLDNQGQRSAFRYAQFVPGGLTKYGTGYVREGVRPPMTAIDSETQDWRAPMEFNEWEQSVEGMRKENGKADLVQGNGRTTGNVAYNPYFHIRVHPLNDQFSAAYDRPELVVVEGNYPESELTSGYRAEGAKNAVGLTDWHAGSVNGQLSPGKKVQTVLSRYFKPRRIVPWDEVAELIMSHIEGENVIFPLNVVPPRLRAELSRRGAKFKGISGSVGEAQRRHLEEVERELAAGNHDFGVEGGLSNSEIAKYNERIKRLSSTDPKTMEGAVTLLSDKLHTPIRIVSKQEAEAEGYRRKKGWYDRATGAITIVTDNHRNVGDIVDTAVHETVGHNGLRQLFETEDKLNNFLDEAYGISSDKIRAEIDRRTERMMDAETERLQEQKRREHEERGEDPESEYYADMAKARIEAEARREQMRRDATEEYAADLAMRIGEEGFERMDTEELTFWGKLKGMLQRALDRLLAGLKLPKMRRWTDKEWSYVMWRSWRNLREGNPRYAGPLAEAEDIARRERSNFGADESRLFRDSDMGLDEAITKMKADAAAANSADFAAKQAAMRAIGGNLSKLRQAMARQREYDITTVKGMTDLSRTLLEAGLLDELSKYETKRILSAIKNAVGKQDTSKQVQTLMDIMVDNQLRMGANYFGKLLNVKGSRVDARGIEVAGELDPEGQKIAQVVRRSTTRTLDDIENMMNEALNRMGSTDQAVAEEAAIEYAGLQIAHQYVEEIRESKNEEKELRKSIDDYKAERKTEAEDAKRSIEQARVHKDAGRMTEHDFIVLEHDIEEEERKRWDAFKQYADATWDAIRQNKIDRAESYRSLSERLGGVLGESVERAKAWREAEKQRVEEIHHNANSDMEGRPTNEHHKADRVQKLANNGALRFVLAPLGTFDQMLRMFGRKNVRGEGYLWNRYMRGWVDCTEREYTGYQKALKELDRKVSEVFGREMKWGDLFAMERRMPKSTVRFWDGGEMREHELTQGNLLYIYMADKMTDGRMKLRRMGITEDDVERIKDFVDPRFIELADWMQEEFLVGKRNEYNAVHKRMFGASMAAIENYFPLKILANARMENVDVADDTSDNILPATSTGSIIKRKRNNLALDVTGADAFSVILDHIQQMERWASFAEYNRDLNTLLSYKRFRNQVMNMTSAYGAGKTLWSNFRNVAAMAAGAYRPPIAPLDKAAVNIAKGVTAAKVSFRVFTALKQFLSMPAYLSDSNPVYLAANVVNPVGAWKWCMENLPLFEKRWKSRMAGDPRLLKSDMDWKMWRSRVVEIAGRVGMSPNAFVDALTVAIGARSMYQTKLEKYKRQGYSLDEARKRAKQDATILFNQTQQSSEGAFLSTMQVDRSWLSVLFTVFRNSSMSYTRQLYDAIRNLSHRLTPGYKGMTEEFMAKQMRRDGIDPDKADSNAKQEYRRGIIRDLVRVGVFGYALQLAWNLGAYLPYLFFGQNGDEKDKMWDDVWNHTMFGSVEGLTGGDVMSAAGEMLLNGKGNPEQLTKEMPLAGDISTILRKMDKDYVSALNDVVNLLVQSGLGFNPQSLTDAAVAVMDYCGEDAKTSRECALLIARIINCPQSQIDKIYFDEIDATGEEAVTMTPEEIAERYAEYKTARNAPLTGWLYSEEGEKKVMNKHKKNATTIMKGRMNSRAIDSRTRELLDNFKEVSDRENEINKLKKSDRDAYREARKKLRESTDLRRHNRVKRYDHDIKRLTEKWLNAKTEAEADSLARAMVKARELMLSDIEGYESNN